MGGFSCLIWPHFQSENSWHVILFFDQDPRNLDGVPQWLACFKMPLIAHDYWGYQE
jgi:hypothetical protein